MDVNAQDYTVFICLMYIPWAAEHRHWLVMRHSLGCSLLQVLRRHGLGRTPHGSILKADLQLLLSSTSTCHWWEMAAVGKHEASDPFGPFSSSMLPAAQSLIFWSRTRGSAAAWLAPFPNSQTGSCPASQQLVPRPGGAAGQRGVRLCSLLLLSVERRQILQNCTVKPDGAVTEQANMATDQICTLMDYTQS